MTTTNPNRVVKAIMVVSLLAIIKMLTIENSYGRIMAAMAFLNHIRMAMIALDISFLNHDEDLLNCHPAFYIVPTSYSNLNAVWVLLTIIQANITTTSIVQDGSTCSSMT